MTAAETDPGPPPGSPADSDNVHTRLYREGALVREDFPIADISDHLGEQNCLLWADLRSPTPEQLARLADEFGLHALAVEDALDRRQRPKIDRYRTHSYLNTHTAAVNTETGELLTSEVSAFILPRALITIRSDDDGVPLASLLARWDATPALASNGVGFLLYGLIDLVVDTHYEAVESLDREIEDLEDLLFDQTGPAGLSFQRRTFELRRSLVLLRRVVLPMREVVNSLMRRDTGLVGEDMFPYFQDVYDHVLRATEWTESLRDMVTSILETNLTIQGNRLNVITKKVTSWAAIIAVPTFITGFYGMNLPYPGFGRDSGLATAVVLMIVCPALLYVAFRRRDWL